MFRALRYIACNGLHPPGSWAYMPDQRASWVATSSTGLPTHAAPMHGMQMPVVDCKPVAMTASAAQQAEVRVGFGSF